MVEGQFKLFEEGPLFVDDIMSSLRVSNQPAYCLNFWAAVLLDFPFFFMIYCFPSTSFISGEHSLL